jgi:hypothetical protein
MHIVVLCNVGNRDVTLEGEARPPHPARGEGRKLLERYDEVAPLLRFPIIEPCLRYVSARHPEGIDYLVTYGTDQLDPTYRDRDTLHFAALAARRLPELLSPALQGAQSRTIEGINPALYDEAFEAFDDLLDDLSDDDIDVCYVAIAGGTPACNSALLLQGVRHFGDRLRVVYVPHQGEPQELRAGQQVMDAFREAAAIEHLERFDFANAVPRLESLGADPGLTGLVRYAAQRFAFDFRSAQTTLLRVLREGSRSVRSFVQKHLRHDLDILLNEASGPRRLKALLRELYWNAAITYHHRRYADFLGRVYRFQEAVLRYLVEHLLELPTDLSPEVRDETIRQWQGWIRANDDLMSFLEARSVNDEPLNWKKIARPTYKALLSYATSDAEGEGLDAEGQPLLSPGERKRYSALLDRVNAFDGLVELRHRTIIGHDFEGVSEAQFKERYKGRPKQGGGRRNSMEGLREIAGMLGIDLQDDPYELIVEFVKKEF